MDLPDPQRFRYLLNAFRQLAVLGRAGRQTEGCIEGAKAYKTGKQKDSGENQQYQPQRSRDGSRIIQDTDDRCCQKANNSVGTSHVLFHDVYYLKVNCRYSNSRAKGFNQHHQAPNNSDTDNAYQC